MTDISSRRLAVMGGQAALTAHGPGATLAVAGATVLLRDLERRWSRFRADSELRALNRAAGCGPVAASLPTRRLVRYLIEAWRRTGGAFDPTVLGSIEALGYDRDLALVQRERRRRTVVPWPGLRPAPTLAGVVVDRVAGTVELPAGCRIDPGGLGRGLAADLAVAAMLEAGAVGACANVGGDLRVAGAAPQGGAWPIAIEDPNGGRRPLLCFGLHDGAVATSGRAHQPGTGGHQLFDPASGRPLRNGLLAVSVVAADGWWADACTKAAFVAGADGAGAGGAVAALERLGVEGVAVAEGGRQERTAGLGALLTAVPGGPVRSA